MLFWLIILNWIFIAILNLHYYCKPLSGLWQRERWSRSTIKKWNKKQETRNSASNKLFGKDSVLEASIQPQQYNVSQSPFHSFKTADEGSELETQNAVSQSLFNSELLTLTGSSSAGIKKEFFSALLAIPRIEPRPSSWKADDLPLSYSPSHHSPHSWSRECCPEHINFCSKLSNCQEIYLRFIPKIQKGTLKTFILMSRIKR